MWEEDQIFPLSAGQILHLWPGREHGSTKPMPPELKFYWIHFEVEETSPVTGLTGREMRHDLIKIPQTTHLPRPESLERLFRIFINEQETGTLCPLSANLLTMLMLIEVAQHSPERASIEDSNVVALWAHSYIRMNFDRPITPSTVAEHLGYNPDYLGRIYRQTYNCTLTEAIHSRRIRKACDYLLNSNLTIGQIASSCGFSDADYFRRIFKRTMKLTPSNYRDENSPMHIVTH
jgi:AraC-like DNA-binding protein